MKLSTYILSEGGNWDYGVYAGHFRTEYRWNMYPREFISGRKSDMEGLQDRWVQIILGKTGWTRK